MAAELASGYVSLTVKLAKGGMADVTKEVKKAGQDGGKAYSDEFNKKVGDEVGKKLPDTVNTSIKKTSSSSSGGFAKAAKGAAGEFLKGLQSGIQSGITTAISSGNITGALEPINKKLKETTGLVKGIGDATGVNVKPIIDVSKNITDAIGGIETAASKGKASLQDFTKGDWAGGLQAGVDALRGLENIGLPAGIADEVQHFTDTFKSSVDQFATAKTQIDATIGSVQTFTSLAGPDSPLFQAGEKLPLVGEFVAFSIAAHQAGNDVEDFIKKKTGLEVPLSGISVVKQLTDNFRDLHSAASNAQSDLDKALAAAKAAGPPPPPHPAPAPPAGHVRAGGGSITGAGGPRSDIIPIWASNGEHVLSAADVAKMGGQSGVYAFRSMLQGFQGGGAIGPDVTAARGRVGTPYSQAARNDCSGMVAQIINAALGMGGGLMSTKTAQSWLAARGFKAGIGGPGTISVGWYDHGPGPNDGHMAMTLSDGENAESGGSHGTFLVGAGAAGASSPQFDQHMFLPNLFGEGKPGSSGVPSSTGGGSGGGGGGGGTGGGGSGATLTGLATTNPYAALQQIGAQRGGAGADQQAFDQQTADQIRKILPDFATLGNIGGQALKDNLPPGFFDYSGGKTAASIGALLHSIGILSGNRQVASILGGVGGAVTGSPGSLYTGIMGAIPGPVGTGAPGPVGVDSPGQFGAPALTQDTSGGGLANWAGNVIVNGDLNDNSGKSLENANKTLDFNKQKYASTQQRSFM